MGQKYRLRERYLRHHREKSHFPARPIIPGLHSGIFKGNHFRIFSEMVFLKILVNRKTKSSTTEMAQDTLTGILAAQGNYTAVMSRITAHNAKSSTVYSSLQWLLNAPSN